MPQTKGQGDSLTPRRRRSALVAASAVTVLVGTVLLLNAGHRLPLLRPAGTATTARHDGEDLMSPVAARTRLPPTTSALARREESPAEAPPPDGLTFTDLIEVGRFFRQDLDAVLERLQLPGHVLRAVAEPAGRAIAAREFALAKTRHIELLQGHSSHQRVRELVAQGLARSEPPPDAVEFVDYLAAYLNGQTVILTYADYPELRDLRAMKLELPRSFRNQLVRRIEEAMPNTLQRQPEIVRPAAAPRRQS